MHACTSSGVSLGYEAKRRLQVEVLSQSFQDQVDWDAGAAHHRFASQYLCINDDALPESLCHGLCPPSAETERQWSIFGVHHRRGTQGGPQARPA